MEGSNLPLVLRDCQRSLRQRRAAPAPVEALEAFAPDYSPALHPHARMWKWLRRVVTHNHWFETLTEHIEANRDVFRSLAGVKEQVRQLCGFKTPESLVASL